MEPLDLTHAELRVLGSLVEKELTTPDQYPLTLNALVLSCNQKSSREPVVNLSDDAVQSAVTSAKTKSLVRFVHPSHGRSVLRYAHTLGDALDVSGRQLALLAVMMLRGPQTLNELRVRTNRMAEFSDLDDLERELGRLSGRDTPLVERQARRTGQKEDRYAHLLGFDRDVPADADSHTDLRPGARQPHISQPETSDLAEQIVELREELAELRQQLTELRQALTELRQQLGD